MNNRDENDRSDVSTPKVSRRAQLHALLFTGAVFGTALVTHGGAAEPKIPPYSGE